MQTATHESLQRIRQSGMLLQCADTSCQGANCTAVPLQAVSSSAQPRISGWLVPQPRQHWRPLRAMSPLVPAQAAACKKLSSKMWHSGTCLVHAAGSSASSLTVVAQPAPLGVAIYWQAITRGRSGCTGSQAGRSIPAQTSSAIALQQQPTWHACNWGERSGGGLRDRCLEGVEGTEGALLLSVSSSLLPARARCASAVVQQRQMSAAGGT